MSERIERPSFFDGQILGARDLAAGVDYERGQLARHERYLHLWGIATGLELKATPRKDVNDNNYVDVTVTAGLAIDGTGREIVVPADDEASPADFENLSVGVANDPQAWYPVFLVGRDDVAPPAPMLPTGCNGTAATRVAEGYAISFGRPGAEAHLDEQDPGAVGDGPGGAAGTEWKVLLGFVQWDAGIKKFKDVSDQQGAFGRHYAGVQADAVAARGGALTFRTQAQSTPNKPGLVLSEEKGGMLKFGPLDPQGGVSTPVFAVDAAGNITGSLATGAVLVESGIATDGVILPLPSGVTTAQVSSGAAAIHSQVSVRVNDSSPPDTTNLWVASPLESYVDADRRLHCRLRWLDNNGTATEDRPATCDYVVIAATPSK